MTFILKDLKYKMDMINKHMEIFQCRNDNYKMDIVKLKNIVEILKILVWALLKEISMS
jgi:hypothetical protein